MPPEPPLRPHGYAPTCSYTGLHADGVSIAITFFNINLDDTRYNAKLERVCHSACRWCVRWYSCLHQHSAWKHPVTMPARPPPADDEWDWSMVHPSEASADLQRQYQSIWDLTLPTKERFRLNFGEGITPPPLGDEDNARFLQSIRQWQDCQGKPGLVNLDHIDAMLNGYWTSFDEGCTAMDLHQQDLLKKLPEFICQLGEKRGLEDFIS